MLTIILANALLVALAVIVHYEFLNHFTVWMPRLLVPHRYRIVLGVIAALTAHVVEIILFGLAYLFIDRNEEWGRLQGNFDNDFASSVYFSFTAYTTLGLGDIEPIGAIRFLVGLESLTGFVLITWTASFLYFEMTRVWDAR